MILNRVSVFPLRQLPAPSRHPFRDGSHRLLAFLTSSFALRTIPSTIRSHAFRPISTDASFRERLLSGHRRELLDTLGLKEPERQIVLSVQADTLERFAAALCDPW